MNSNERLEYMRQWRLDNPTKIKVYNKLYYVQHRETIIERGKKYYLDHYESELARHARYRERTREHIRAYQRDYYRRKKEEGK